MAWPPTFREINLAPPKLNIGCSPSLNCPRGVGPRFRLISHRCGVLGEDRMSLCFYYSLGRLVFRPARSVHITRGIHLRG